MISADSSCGEAALDLLMIAKYLERIGDHATNIAEWVYYAAVSYTHLDVYKRQILEIPLLFLWKAAIMPADVLDSYSLLLIVIPMLDYSC